MAVTIVQSPGAYGFALNRVAWTLKIDDIGSGPIEKKIGYFLAKSGDQVTSLETIPATVNDQEVTIDFSEDIQAMLYTDMPQVNSGISYAPVSAPNANGIFELRYGEVIVDKENCTNQILISQTSDQVIVFNGGYNYDESQRNESSYVMQSVPRYLELCSQSMYYLYLRRGEEDSIEVKIFSKDPGGLEIEDSVNFLHRTGYIELDPYKHSGQTGSDTIRVEVHVNSVLKSQFEISYKNCCTDSVTVMYLSPKGGRPVINLGAPVDRLVDSQYQVLNRRVIYNSGTQVTSRGGTTTFNKRPTKKLTFEYVCHDPDGMESVLLDFLSAAGYHIQTKVGNAYRYDKAILNDGTLSYAKIDSDEILVMNITLEIAIPLLSHMMDI